MLKCRYNTQQDEVLDDIASSREFSNTLVSWQVVERPLSFNLVASRLDARWQHAIKELTSGEMGCKDCWASADVIIPILLPYAMTMLLLA